MTNETKSDAYDPRLWRFVLVFVAVFGSSVSVIAWKAGWLGASSPVQSTTAATSEPQTPTGHANSVETSSSSKEEVTQPPNHQEIDQALDAASQYVNADRLGEADVILSALFQEHPQNVRVLQQLYELRLFQQKYEQAYVLIREVLAQSEGDPEQHWMAGTIAFQLQKFVQAGTHYLQAELLDASNPKYPLYLAQTHIKLHEYDEARVQLLRVIHLDGDIHQAYGTLAEVDIIENKLEMAAQNLSRARKISPDFLKWRILEAQILRRQGNPEAALARLNAIPDKRTLLDDSVVSEKALCWAMLGRPKKAAAEYVAQVNAFPQAWRSAAKASEYLLIAKDELKARTWFVYARDRAPENAVEIRDLAARFAALENANQATESTKDQ